MSWIQSFLAGIIQQVALEGTLSSSAAVLSGVLLFLRYFKDSPSAVRHSSVRLFADDSVVYRRIKDQHDQALLQEDLDSPGEWVHTWQMEFNPSKCSIIHITPNKLSLDIQLLFFFHGQTLETSASKYLGITISSILSCGPC